MSAFEPWKCHANPAHLNGARCNFINTRRSSYMYQGREVQYCERCGCTKIASDIRRRKLERVES